jgi:hypothetical protein
VAFKVRSIRVFARLDVDVTTERGENGDMSIDTTITEPIMHELEQALERATKGVRDPEAMRKSFEAMNRSREELRQRIGTVDIAVDLIRDARNP